MLSGILATISDGFFSRLGIPDVHHHMDGQMEWACMDRLNDRCNA